MQDHGKARAWTDALLMLLYTLLILALLILVMAGVLLYRHIETTRRENSARRTAYSYLQTKVAGYEGTEGVALRDIDGVTCLCLPEGASGIEVRVFLWNGSLMEHTVKKEAPLAPDKAAKVCDLEKLAFRWEGQNLLVADLGFGTVPFCVMGGGNPNGG